MRGNVTGINSGDDLQQWFRDIPLVTKFFCTGTLVMGLMVTFNWIGIDKVVFISDLIRNKFHFWRLITPFLFAGKFSFGFAMHMMVLYENCRRYENNPYNTGGGGTTADFIYMILIGAAIILSIAHIYDFFILSEPILYMIMYVWSRRDPDVLLNIYGFRFKGLYLPWIYLAIRLVMGNDIILPLIGIGVGHLYYFAVVVLPTTYNLNIVQTPKFCIDLANYYSGTTPRAVPAGSDPRSERLARGAGYQWGRGHVLGAAN